MRPSAKREGLLVALGGITFSVAFSYPVLGRLGEAGFNHDWDFVWQLNWVAYRSVAHFHQLPLWNPYKCGGMPLLANPQSSILTPFFLLHLLFGPFVGLLLEIPLHLAISWTGGYVLARVLGLGPLAACLCASVFPGSSWFYLHLSVGHAVFLPSLYLPWIAVLGWLGIARRRLLFAALAGMLVALTLAEGGVYAVSQALLLLGLVGLTLGVQHRSLWPIVTVLTIGVFAAGFAAPKLLPAIEMMRSYPRPFHRPEPHSLASLLDAILSRDQQPFRPHLALWEFHEHGAYVGPIVMVLAAMGIAAAPRRTVVWVGAATVLLLLAMGDAFGPLSPWALLHQIPVFSSERVTPRFHIPFTLTVGVLAGFGVEVLRSRWHNRLGRGFALLLVAAVVIDLWSVGPANLREVFTGREPARPVSTEFRQVFEPFAWQQMTSLALANMGAIDCYEYTRFPTNVKGANQAGYRGEHYLLGAGSVSLIEWTPNVLRYAVDASAPGILVVNQNYDPSWYLAEGVGEVWAPEALLGVDVPAGKQELTLVYGSHLFRTGLAVAMLTGVAMLGLALLQPGRRDPRAGAS